MSLVADANAMSQNIISVPSKKERRVYQKSSRGKRCADDPLHGNAPPSFGAYDVDERTP